MKTVKAFAPGNISLIFKIVKGESASTTGSCGLGFTVNKGVIAEVSEASETRIELNNKKNNLPTVQSVIRALTEKNIHVSITSELPLGCGFGISGASALATAYALNELFNLKKEKKDLAMIAHIAEVENGTGLGDVTNQFYGGFILKQVPSYQFKVIKIPCTSTRVHWYTFDALTTKGVIESDKFLKKINNASNRALQQIKILLTGDFSLEKIVQISKQFAINSGLINDENVLNTIQNIEKKHGQATMIMLGNSVLSTIPFENSQEIFISERKAEVI